MVLRIIFPYLFSSTEQEACLAGLYHFEVIIAVSCCDSIVTYRLQSPYCSEFGVVAAHFDISDNERQSLFNYIRLNGVATERTPFEDLFMDEDDRVFYEVALTEEDSFLVTGNLKHYPVDPRVVTPAQMVAILEG